jgi:uncharacterized protein
MATVSVRGEALIEADPELAGLSITVVARDSDQGRALATLSDRVGAAQALIARFETGIDSSSTSDLSVYPQLSDKHGARVRGYEGRATHSVMVSDFGILSDLILGVGAIELAQIHGPCWHLRQGSPVYRDTRLAAVQDAVGRARDYAAALACQVTSLIELSDLGMSSSVGGFTSLRAREPRNVGVASMSDTADGPSFDLSPMRQQITGQIEARFSMTDPDLTSR